MNRYAPQGLTQDLFLIFKLIFMKANFLLKLFLLLVVSVSLNACTADEPTATSATPAIHADDINKKPGDPILTNPR